MFHYTLVSTFMFEKNMAVSNECVKFWWSYTATHICWIFWWILSLPSTSITVEVLNNNVNNTPAMRWNRFGSASTISIWRYSLTLFQGVMQICITLYIFFNTVKAQICTHLKLFDFQYIHIWHIFAQFCASSWLRSKCIAILGWRDELRIKFFWLKS